MAIQFSNPYYNLTAVRDLDMFYGREILLRQVLEMLANYQSVALIGPRGIGKSSILCCARFPELHARYSFDLSHHIFVLLDLREYLYKTDADFFHDVCKEILHQAKFFSGLKLSRKGHSANDFSDLVNQVKRQGFHLVLLLDAFSNVTKNKQFSPEFFSFLRAHASSGKVSYVTATIARLHELSHHDVKDSPFFNVLLEKNVEALTEDEALALISEPAARAGMPFSQEEISWVRKYAGLHPLFIQLVCSLLFEIKLQSAGGNVDLREVRNKAHRALQPYMDKTWKELSEQQQKIVQDEAQLKDKPLRELPELSESAFFRQFVRDTCEKELFKMSVKDVEDALNKLDNPAALGETNLHLMKAVAQRLGDDPSAAEKGKAIREALNEAFERMCGTGPREDSAPDWMLYNILYYRYFKHHLKNNVISPRLGYPNDRAYYRDRTKALEALRNNLLEIE